MADEEQQRPIIIKKVKKGGHGHHGGAWKVAYADFVTAMMAFFLLLWLISSVDEAKLEGLAEYFTPTIGIKDSMGIGFEGGESPSVEGQKKTQLSPPGVVIGQVPQGPIPEEPEKETLIEADKDAKLFEKAEEAMKKAFEADPNLRDLSDNVILEQTPEGLKIDITDSDKYPMFDPGSSILTNFGRRILSKMSGVIEKMPNFISITGHTDAVPFGRGIDYTNWELSTDRANAARRYLLRSGMNPERPKKVTGKAATDLLVPENPRSARNRRITIILLRGSHMDLRPGDLPATRDLLSVPTPTRPKQPPRIIEAPTPAPVKPSDEKTQTPEASPEDARPVGALGASEKAAEEALQPKTDTSPNVGVNDVLTPSQIPRERSREDFAPFMDE